MTQNINFEELQKVVADALFVADLYNLKPLDEFITISVLDYIDQTVGLSNSRHSQFLQRAFNK